MTDVHLRLVSHINEIAPLTFVASESWADDPLFAWMVPGRFTRPDHYLKFWKYTLIKEFNTPGRKIVIAEKRVATGTTVLGFAIWEPPTSSRYRETQSLKQKFQKLIGRTITSIQILRLITFTTFTKTCSLPKVRELMQEQKDRYARDPLPDQRWFLHFLGVSPRYQRQGVGKYLLNWGIEKADEESMPSYLEATARGRPLYESAGFVTFDWQVLAEGEVKHAIMKRNASATGNGNVGRV